MLNASSGKKFQVNTKKLDAVIKHNCSEDKFVKERNRYFLDVTSKYNYFNSFIQ